MCVGKRISPPADHIILFAINFTINEHVLHRVRRLRAGLFQFVVTTEPKRSISGLYALISVGWYVYYICTSNIKVLYTLRVIRYYCPILSQHLIAIRIRFNCVKSPSRMILITILFTVFTVFTLFSRFPINQDNAFISYLRSELTNFLLSFSYMIRVVFFLNFFY